MPSTESGLAVAHAAAEMLGTAAVAIVEVEAPVLQETPVPLVPAAVIVSVSPSAVALAL